MGKRTILLLVIAIGLIAVAGKFLLFPDSQKVPLNSPAGRAVNTPITPSETTKTYTDPSGFSFNYPDNLSLAPNGLTDATYAEVQLSAKGVEGNLVLKITDSKFASLDSWAKSIKDAEGAPKEAKLGTLKALELKVDSGLKMAAIDQGVIFSIDVSRSDFWNKVYNKVLADFSFTTPEAGSVVSSDDVIFEGEEVIE